MKERLKCYFTPERVRRIAALAVILLTLALIFSQSMKGKDASTEDSERVAGLLSKIFSPDTPLGGFIHGNIRKIAHFCEYGLLGAECTAYLFLFVDKRLRGAAYMSVFAFFAAFTDETIQIFSGRGPMIADVWLDVAGFFCLSAITAAAFILFNKIRQTLRLRKEKNKETS